MGTAKEILCKEPIRFDLLFFVFHTVWLSVRFILDEVSGSSFDWVKGVAEIPITMLFELRDIGQNGFLLPTDQIIPNSEEIMACLVNMDNTTRALRYYERSGSTNVLASVMSLVMSIVFLTLCL